MTSGAFVTVWQSAGMYFKFGNFFLFLVGNGAWPHTSEWIRSNGAEDTVVLFLLWNGSAENLASLQPLQSDISEYGTLPSKPADNMYFKRELETCPNL